MSRTDTAAATRSEDGTHGTLDAEVGLETAVGELPRRVVVPGLIGMVASTLALVAIVLATPSVWQLLGIGRGLVPPGYYHVSGFVVVLATTFGQAVGWAVGSALLYYVLTLAGMARGGVTARAAMSVVYLGLGALPLLVYHALFGSWLLGLPREGLEASLETSYPDAAWLLFGAHPLVDLALVPLGAIFLGVLWLTGWRERRGLQTVLALALFGTSLAVALSLAIHSTFVHLKF